MSKITSSSRKSPSITRPKPPVNTTSNSNGINSRPPSLEARPANGNSLTTGGNTQEKPLPPERDKGGSGDQTDISKECKDENCPNKDDKDKGKVDELVDMLKGMFEQMNQQKAQDQQGGAQGGGGDQGGAKSPAGGGGGGPSQAGGAAPTGQTGNDPVAKLEEALQAVEKAQSPQAKKVAQEKLKKLHEAVKTMGTQLPEQLERRIEKALAGSSQQGTGSVGGPSSFATTPGVGAAMSQLLGTR